MHHFLFAFIIVAFFHIDVSAQESTNNSIQIEFGLQRSFWKLDIEQNPRRIADFNTSLGSQYARSLFTPALDQPSAYSFQLGFSYSKNTEKKNHNHRYGLRLNLLSVDYSMHDREVYGTLNGSQTQNRITLNDSYFKSKQLSVQLFGQWELLTLWKSETSSFSMAMAWDVSANLFEQINLNSRETYFGIYFFEDSEEPYPVSTGDTFLVRSTYFTDVDYRSPQYNAGLSLGLEFSTRGKHPLTISLLARQNLLSPYRFQTLVNEDTFGRSFGLNFATPLVQL